ncbi:Trichoplein keratin filament-binding protein isoform 1 [Schistosoma japonicum]|nr:Trichoplein keratin filament-binding protein isoform 1 [Schistosoma japonicum]
MLIRSTALKQARDSEKAKMAENLLTEHFRKNNPDLREMFRAADQNGTIDRWKCQLNELKEQKQSEKLDQIVHGEMESDAKLYEEKQAEEMELQRLQAREKHLEYLRKQLDELHSRENKAKQLIEKEKCLINQLVKLDQLENQRRLIEEKCQRELYGRELLHQHHTALRKRSTLIQNELKADLDWLHQLEKQELSNNEASIELKQKEKEDILSMQKLVECELKKEQIRELELNELESYEASKLWAKREEEWRKETAARQKLLQEVIEDRRKQIEDQLALNQQFQREELASREEFLETIENANLIDKLEKETRSDELIEQSNQLNNQLNQKVIAKRLAENEAKADYEAQEKAELAYEEMLKREAENLHLKQNQLKNLTYYRSSNAYSNRNSHY